MWVIQMPYNIMEVKEHNALKQALKQHSAVSRSAGVCKRA